MGLLLIVTAQPSTPTSLCLQRKQLASIEATKVIGRALHSGLIPWRNDVVNDPNAGLPLNVGTGKPFTPISTLLLQTAAKKNGFVGRWWGTRTAWERLASEQSGEATIIYDECWMPAEVFCIDQIDGSVVDQFRVHDRSAVSDDDANFDRIDGLIAETDADIRVGVGDRYHGTLWDGYVPANPWISFPCHTKGDYILLRTPELRSRSSHVYTILHELVHWAEVRTNWIDEMPLRELVAEVGSGWLALELGCPPCPSEINHREFLYEWLRMMRLDCEYIVRAADQARAAFGMVMLFDEEDSDAKHRTT